MKIEVDTPNPADVANVLELLAQAIRDQLNGEATEPAPKPYRPTTDDWIDIRSSWNPRRRTFMKSFVRQAGKRYKLLSWPTDQYLGLFPRDRSRMVARIVPGGVVLLRDVPEAPIGTRVTSASEIKNHWTAQVTLDSRKAVNNALELLGKSASL